MDPFIRPLSGDHQEGAKLVVRIEPPGGRAMSFKPTVLSMENERELRWLGSFLSRGCTRFTQPERFSGILVRAFESMLDKAELDFEQVNAAQDTG